MPKPSIVPSAKVGGLLGVVCAVSSVFVAGAGHGWVSALPFGLLSLVLFPVAFARLRRRSVSLAVSAALVLVGLVLDLMLYKATLSEGIDYFLQVQFLAVPWLGLWSTWQLAALFKFFLSATSKSETSGFASALDSHRN